MKMFTFRRQTNGFSRLISRFLLIAILAGPVAAQQQTPPKPPPAQTAAVTQAPAFDELLATDSYKMYGEVRNVGQLLSNGGAGEIVDPIVKLSDPGPQFKSIISFLKKNSEALAQSRLMFATWPVRTDIPMVFVAIEFPTNEEAAKFAPKLETFLPTVLPPVPVPTETPEAKPAESEKQPAPKTDKPAARPSPAEASPTEVPKPLRQTRAAGSRMMEEAAVSAQAQQEERLPFVITRAGNLVCITEKDFKFSKLRPKDSRPLSYDQNFRTARDQFSSEPIFFFFNVALEDKTKPSPTPTPFITAEEAARVKAQEIRNAEALEAVTAPSPVNATSPEPVLTEEKQTNVLSTVTVTASPTPTPTKEEQAQRIASNQIGQLLDSIGYGEPQFPEAVGVAVALEGNEYIVRAIMIDKPEVRKTPIPFVPQLVGGPAFTSEAASVLPDDTDVLVSASIDLLQTYDGMRRESEKRHKADASPRSQTYENGVLVSQGRPRNESPDVFASFEKNSGMKIKEELLPAFGHEIAIAGSLKTLSAAGVNVMGAPTLASPTSEADKEKAKKEPKLPVLLIEVKDRDAARPLMPKILTGLGVGEANLLAQTEKQGDTEMVNYAGIFAYAFVGDFVVISDSLGVRKVVDAYNNHTTLSSNTVFRNSRRWQSSRTSGQVYVSPALMEGYQDQIRKSSATMDAGLRDFLLGLNPNAEAITYALSDDGMGLRHELRLPKNYILMTIASVSSATKNPPAEMNEAIAAGSLQWIASAETQYKQGPGKGSYGTLQQLVEAKLYQPADSLDKYGYKFDLNVTSAAFEATATPKEYGKGGKRSFFIDQTGVVRGDDHAGAPATVADKPVQQ